MFHNDEEGQFNRICRADVFATAAIRTALWMHQGSFPVLLTESIFWALRDAIAAANTTILIDLRVPFRLVHD
jgi:hypothetical protein